MPRTNPAGLALIAKWEGERLRAYDDGTGTQTIGFGHTANVHAGQTCTHEQALAFLATDVAWAEKAVAYAVHVTLTPNQFAALVSWQYNTGAILGSRVVKYINLENFPAAMQHLAMYVYSNGVFLEGLQNRRAAEIDLFNEK